MRGWVLQLSTLGSVDLRAPDNRVLDPVLAQPKRVALLVYLAAGRPAGFHRRDRLVALFWPDLDAARARDALSQALRFLRQALGADVVLTRGVDEVGIDSSRVWCDAVAFRATVGRDAGGALELYRGDFLDGFFVDEAPGFEDWAESERAALRELAARGARQLAEQHACDGSHTLAVGWGRRAVELAPDDERGFRRLLGWLDRAGDKAGALQAYDEFARRLRAEYGAEPADETRALADAIRRATRVSPVVPASPPGRVAPPSGDARRVPDIRDSSPWDPLAIGATLAAGNYVLEGILGSGGMATVYLAHDVRHDRRVAVKVLRPDIAAGIGTAGLLHEIRIAARLQHPHIVPLFDSGESNGHVFYVMPHVAGESLRARLQRESTIPLELAIRIARDVADALAYAHRRGIVHRDIKPDNILLSGDSTSNEFHALVADFGIAKALGMNRSSVEFGPALTLATVSAVMGTPGYMAPEQAAGGPVDSRTDVYAWGIVAYEMISGAHPFMNRSVHGPDTTAPSAAATPLDALAKDVPGSLVELVRQCLTVEPASRPRDGVALADAIRGVSRRSPGRGDSQHWRAMSVAAVLLAAAGLTWAGLKSGVGVDSRGAPTRLAARGSVAALDTTRYAILPFVYDSVARPSHGETERLRDAFARWSGVSLVDEFQLGEAVSRRRTRRLTLADAHDVATELGAGRYVRGDVQVLGETARLHVGLYDTRTNKPLRDTTFRFDSAVPEVDSVFARVADHLLFGAGPRSNRFEVRVGTRSRPARQALVAAQTALERWDLTAADSQLFAATRFDPTYTQAWLWLAQVRWWRRAPEAEWKEAAERSAAESARLTSRDEGLAEALLAASRGEIVRACARFASLAHNDQYDFPAWYSTSDCLARDDAVVRDSNSPSGWKFRSSYHQSILAYRRAVELLPSIHRALRDGAFASVRVRLRTAGNFTRRGREISAGTSGFVAYPAWQGDTLAFVPYPEARFLAADPEVIPSSRREAVLRQRQLFHEIAVAWAAEFPESPDAQEALAISLQLLGDPAALDTIQRARRLASHTNDRIRLAALEVWTRVRFGLPSDVTSLRAARSLADSLLRATHEDSVSDVRLLASLAALTGRAAVTARLARHRSVREAWGVPSALSDVVPALWAYSAFGGPADSLDALEKRFEVARRTRLSATDASLATDAWLVRAGVLAFPEHRLAMLQEPLSANGYYLRAAVAALISADTATARRILNGVARARMRTQPEDRAVDALYTEARVLDGVGDRRAATEWLDPTLEAVSTADPLLLADPMRAGPLIRAIALRADLAAALGDATTARRWAEVVRVFWSDADPFLQPLVKRMMAHAR